jgi:hypothetical protein
LKEVAYIFILSLVSFHVKAQSFKTDTMLLKGKYFGKNLYVQNPPLIKGNDTIYTAQQVLVNDSLVLNFMQLQKSAFAIPLTKLHLKEGDAITVKIVQWNFNRVRILNP